MYLHLRSLWGAPPEQALLLVRARVERAQPRTSNSNIANGEGADYYSKWVAARERHEQLIQDEDAEVRQRFLQEALAEVAAEERKAGRVMSPHTATNR